MRVHKLDKLRKHKELVDAKKILSKVKAKDKDKAPVTLYINKTLLGELKKRVGQRSISKLFEELGKEFLETLDKDKK